MHWSVWKVLSVPAAAGSYLKTECFTCEPLKSHRQVLQAVHKGHVFIESTSVQQQLFVLELLTTVHDCTVIILIEGLRIKTNY